MLKSKSFKCELLRFGKFVAEKKSHLQSVLKWHYNRLVAQPTNFFLHWTI